MYEFIKVGKDRIINLKEVLKQQNGTKNKIYTISKPVGEGLYKVIAGSKSGKRSIDELLELYEKKYSKYILIEIIR